MAGAKARFALDETQKWARVVHHIRQQATRRTELRKIERRGPLARVEFQEEYAKTSTPVIIEDMLESWPLTFFSFQRLKTRFGQLEVWPRVGNYVEKAFSSDRRHVKMSLSDYVDFLSGDLELEILGEELQSGLPPYLGNLAMPTEMSRMLTYPAYFPNEIYAQPRMWLGPPGAVTPLHADIADTFLAQVFGHKEICLVSPRFWEALQPWCSNARLYASGVDPQKTANVPWRNFEQLTVVLTAGDTLFIPGGWFHHVQTVKTSLSVSFFVDHQPPLAALCHPASRTSPGGRAKRIARTKELFRGVNEG